MEYGVLKLGSLVLMLIGSKKVKSTALPTAGGVNGNLLALAPTPVTSAKGLANPGEPVAGGLGFENKGASVAPADCTPNGGAPKFCKAVSSSKRLKKRPNPPRRENLPGPPEILPR